MRFSVRKNRIDTEFDQKYVTYLGVILGMDRGSIGIRGLSFPDYPLVLGFEGKGAGSTLGDQAHLKLFP